MSNDDLRPGDRVRIGAASGTVIGVIERTAFADPREARRWMALGRGVLVQSDDGDLQHVLDAGGVLVKI